MDGENLTNPVEETKDETFADPSSELETTETTETSPEDKAEEDGPFHKNPRWIAREQKMKTYESELGQTKAELEELRQFKKEMESRLKQDEPVNIPEEFKVAFGDDPEAFKAMDAYLKKTLQGYEELKAEKIAMEAEQKAKDEAKWEAWTDEQMDSLGVTEESERNALMKIMIDNSEPDSLYNVYDKDGNFDFSKGLKILEQSSTKTNTTEAKKSINDRTRGTGEAPKKDFLTWADTRKMGWR